jgi:surface polysaccharide O-acyltransferase-like enzyme
MNRKSNLQDVALLRDLAIFSIVVWHTYCPYTCWGVANSPANEIYSDSFTRIFSVAVMPLFTVLAGYLFCFLLGEKGKYRRFKVFL